MSHTYKKLYEKKSSVIFFFLHFLSFTVFSHTPLMKYYIAFKIKKKSVFYKSHLTKNIIVKVCVLHFQNA